MHKADRTKRLDATKTYYLRNGESHEGYIYTYHVSTLSCLHTHTDTSCKKKQSMDLQLVPASPVLAQADCHVDSQWFRIPSDITWSEYEASSANTSLLSNDSWLDYKVPCGGCCMAPCACPKCPFCRTRVVGQVCSCRMNGYWNSMRSIWADCPNQGNPIGRSMFKQDITGQAVTVCRCIEPSASASLWHRTPVPYLPLPKGGRSRDG